MADRKYLRIPLNQGHKSFNQWILPKSLFICALIEDQSVLFSPRVQQQQDGQVEYPHLTSRRGCFTLALSPLIHQMTIRTGYQVPKRAGSCIHGVTREGRRHKDKNSEVLPGI